MGERAKPGQLNRRDFMKVSAAAGAGALFASGTAAPEDLDRRNEQSGMPYRKLGRTNFMCSRLVFGCGAALAGGRAVHLLDRAIEAGVNHFDVGYNDYYRGSEGHLGQFVKDKRDQVWITSKAPARVARNLKVDDEVTLDEAKAAAKIWLNYMDKSLQGLQMDYVDSYYIMGVSNPSLMRSEELRAAFEKARDAGKVRHWGFSSHENAQECLETAIDTGWYDLAMIAVTPAGWYDYRAGKLVDGKGSMKQLRPLLERARQSGVGLVGMKAARYIAVRPYGGVYGKVNDESIMTAFDKFYEKKLLDAPLSPYQRSYAFVLENGMDVVNADMQNIKHFEENLAVARASAEYFA